ncbi:MAG: deoxyguanosinetriphosphate triphosphohydrolase [Planctomycetota bacterium]|nr:deoxyguanosinetriphosphate triphosphohydrolase [Planctomycetota bacterium]
MSQAMASYAVDESRSRGRKFPEKRHPYRSEFERDRDRIIHCSAFRRLEGKTQVFSPGLDDYYRTRLTHSIEVSQIGRTIARELMLNETLTEAICLAHDLGHPPFGHAGEKVLNHLMEKFAGFEHNRQSLRIVDLLEHPYPDFAGLNLMYETRLGLGRHKSRYDQPDDKSFSQVNCSLEGQVTDAADRIAYNCHDLEDGMRAGIISQEQLKQVELFTAAKKQIHAEQIEDQTIRRTRTAKAIIDMLVSDCLDESKKAICAANIKTVDEVCGRGENLISLSAENEKRLTELENFLMENFYLHKSVIQAADKIKEWLSRLFEKFCNRPELMPGYFQRLISMQGLQRSVCDYIAGMTDRFCQKTLED